MRALDRKLLRDLAALRAQAATIALVVAAGLGGFVGSLSTVSSLEDNRDAYYASARLADVFATVRRAPEHVAQGLATLPDVAEVQSAVMFDVQVDRAGVAQPLTGRVVGIDPARAQRGLNRLTLRSGRWPAPGTTEALVSEAFAQARALRPGDEVHALLDGHRQRLAIVGVALSPEYVFAAAAGGRNDETTFGVFWIDRARLAAAFDMTGAFNAVALRLRAGASVPAAIGEIDRRLRPYGSRGAYGRDEQPSHKAVAQELREQRVFGIVLPSVVLGVAMFVLHVVLDRQVATQREQIAALVALGYENRVVVAHYLKLALAIAAAGIVLGLGVGHELGRQLTRLYADYFRFPDFRFALDAGTVVGGTAAFGAAALAGAWGATRRLLSLSPAQAMRPPSPPAYRPLLLERAGLARHVGPRVRMILRNLERRAVRAALTTAGIASAVAILIGGTWWGDAIDTLIDRQFAAAQPGEVFVGFTGPLGERVVHELAALPGVLRAEARRSVPVRLHAGHRRERTVLSGVSDDARLWRLVDAQSRPTRAPPTGLLMTDRLASRLGVAAGDTVRVEFLDGRQREIDALVVDLTHEPIGLGAWMDEGALRALAGDGAVVDAGALAIDRTREAELFAALKRAPRVAAVFVKSALIEYFRATSARNILIFTTVLTAFASAIAVGVVYNSARIALAERAWELATLRVLGFEHREVAALLLGELALEMALALPLGFVAGAWLARAMTGMMASENFTMPTVILPGTFAYAGLTMLAAGAACAWLVQRRLAALDLVAVLKTRE